jgi:predicted acyltransferase
MTNESATPPSAPRIASMDQFRGLTILGMFAVHYAGGFNWGVDLSAVFRHNGFYLSVGDLFFPWFHFAAGFSLRLALLRRLATVGPLAAYRRTVRRCLLLILLAWAPFLLVERPRSWDMLSGAGALAHVAAFLKSDGWDILAIIGITSLWILPVVGRSARVRGAFLVGSVVVHALLCQFFYVDFVYGQPNPVDALLGTVGVLGREGGPLGFLSWGWVQLAGSFAYDIVAAGDPRWSTRRLLSWSAVLMMVGYGLHCLSTLYPPSPSAGEDRRVAASPVLPPTDLGVSSRGRPSIAPPPFVWPKAEQQRPMNYWLMSRHLGTPPFHLFATGLALGVLALLVRCCDLGGLQVGVLRTFGQNPLIAYILHMQLGGAIASVWPETGGWPVALAGAMVRFACEYLTMRLLERRRIFLRL